MTFLQPWLLLALPLVALPVIIHLINQRRFQSVEWAAMMFLLSAQALSRGTSRLRYWLIMLLRMLAVAAVILAVSRPLSRGWLAAVAGDRSSATIVLLDRSPSMSQAAGPGGESKRATARRQVAAALETLGATSVVLIDSVSCAPQELASPRAIEEVPEAGPADASADMPLMLQAACDHLAGMKSAAGTIWICSDQRANDWKPADSAWPAIRERLKAMPRPVRLTLLAYPETAADNLAVRVVQASLEPRGNAWELLLDITIARQSDGGPIRVPVQIELGPARSTVEIELTGTAAVLPRHAIPIDTAAMSAMRRGAGSDQNASPMSGWGRVSIPADSDPADNDFYFVFGTPPVRRTLVVTEDEAGADRQVARTLQLVAGIPPDTSLQTHVETATPDGAVAMPLDDVALVLWRAPLPESAAADGIGRFVDRGGQVIFLPPSSLPIQSAVTAAFAGMRWLAWEEHSPPLRPSSWRSDEGLLAATLTGAALPVGDLEIRRSCRITGEGTPLAVLPGGRPLFVRVARRRGGISFLATTPAAGDSDLAANGVVLYAIVQRAIDAGLGAIGFANQVDAGKNVLNDTSAGGGAHRPETPREDWRQIGGPAAASTEVGFHAGVHALEARLLAVNRPAAEDVAAVVDDRRVESLFQGLAFTRFQQNAGGLGSLVQEVWRPFLIAVLLALLAEGLLCLPRSVRGGRRAGEAAA